MTAYGRGRVTFGHLHLDGDWCTYAEAAARLGLSVEAVRQRAIRNKWARMLGNDKRSRIRLPDQAYPTRTPVIRAPDPALTSAFENHIKTLQADNEALKQDLMVTRADLSAHVETLKGELETLKGQLAGAEARAGEEAAKTAQAIAAFEALAQRLEAMAEARRPSWWSWLRFGFLD